MPIELFLLLLFFIAPTVVIGIMMFRQMKNAGIALLNGDKQESIKDPPKKTKGKVLWSIFIICLMLAGLGGYVGLEKKDNTFKDCAECPKMVVVPSGSFTMGSPDSEDSRYDEVPRHSVNIDYRFAVGVYEVTFTEWAACANAGGCGGYIPDDEGWSRDNRPVINVSWDDAQSYVRWLSSKTGHKYGLLSESEWEYVARAGTETRYSWGNEIGRNRANCDGCGSRWDDKQTAPAGSFSPNAWGVYDMHGNVWEWVQDCYTDSYLGAPFDGSPRTSENCDRRVLRGGSWSVKPWYLRSADRFWLTTDYRLNVNGFRIVRRF